MRICPDCRATFRDDVRFCLNDGTELVASTAAHAPMDNYEESETIIRHEPVVGNDSIVINFSKPETASEPMLIDFSDVETVVHPPSQSPPRAPTATEGSSTPAVTVIERKAPPTSNYALFLVIGLFVGGGLVLLTLLLARSFFSEGSNPGDGASVNQTTAQSGSTASRPLQTAAAKHETPNPSADAGALNGSVIAANAYVRALPDKDSAEIDVLPIADRLQIEKRENDSSPWYLVTCEHGSNGWMHGNTIAFKQTAGF